MIDIQVSPLVIGGIVAFVAAYIYIIIRRKFLREKFARPLSHAKPIAALLCVPAGFLLMELPYNDALLSMNPFFVVCGLVLTGVLFAFVFFVGQRSKTSMMVFLIACFIVGVANHFVAVFKGQPILPSDVAALQTAVAVGGGYTYTIDDAVMGPFLIVLAFACLIALLPKTTIARRQTAANLIVALAVAAGGCAWFSSSDIEEDLNCSVDVWSSLDSYKSNGSLLCFLQRSQKIMPDAPENYSHDEAEALLATAVNSTQSVAYAADADDVSTLPSIIVIMNETYSDISRYSAVDDSYTGPQAIASLADEALLSGDVYVSALGGGTCNSEFEFLTGSSMGLLGAGVYPYMFYNLSGVDNVASYLGSLGYTTSAVHPAEASNWRRDRIYTQLGFDEFYDITSFEDAETRRELVTDAATYDFVLDLLENSNGPQFIFDVTIANHSGYDTGEIPEDGYVEVSVDGELDDEVSEYVSCITYSDAEFLAFIEELEELDRPVVVCMFGDHQPSFADRLAEASYGVSVEDMTLEQTQERYTTPFIIWTNSDELREAYGTGTTTNMSLNYLASNLLEAAGLSLDDQFSYLASVQEEIPAINLNGYQDSDSVWHYLGEESDASEAYNDLATVQYDNLFDQE